MSVKRNKNCVAGTFSYTSEYTIWTESVQEMSQLSVSFWSRCAKCSCFVKFTKTSFKDSSHVPRGTYDGFQNDENRRTLACSESPYTRFCVHPGIVLGLSPKKDASLSGASFQLAQTFRAKRGRSPIGFEEGLECVLSHAFQRQVKNLPHFRVVGDKSKKQDEQVFPKTPGNTKFRSAHPRTTSLLPKRMASSKLAPQSLSHLWRCGSRASSQCWIEIKAIQIHHLVPGRDEITCEFLLCIFTGINFRNRS